MYPVVLSFDVGIIHLSYCLLTYKDKWEILEWNNINLTECNNKSCHCGDKALYTNNIDNIDNYYCKKHAITHTINFEDLFEKHLKSDIKCCYVLKSNNPCTKHSNYLLKNNTEYYCTLHSKQYYGNVNKNCNLKELKQQKASTINFNDLKYNLIMELENRKHLLRADYVVIENQPSFKNPRMKSIASSLYDYYLIRGIIDKKTTLSNIKEVKFISPSNKLKNIKIKENKVEKESDSKTYRVTKNLGIQYCLELIDNLDEWKQYFKTHKKKDDLADSFLQGVYFYKTLKFLPLNQ
jgi:hypothetical protein